MVGNFFGGAFFGGGFFGTITSGPVVTAGNNTFWKKGYRQIGQKRRWRYWWEQDPTTVPDVIPVPETVEEIKQEIADVNSYITDLVIERAAAGTLEVMRAYAEILQEQSIVKQQAVAILSAKEKEQEILKRKRQILLLNG